MRFVFALFAFACIVFAQAPATSKTNTETPADTVVAVVNGRKITADEVRKMVATIPVQAQEAFSKNPQQFMREYANYMHLQGLAEKASLDKQSPYKERLEFQRMLTLVQAMYDKASSDVVVSREEEKGYYEANRNKYREVQAKLIYVPFGTGPTAEIAGKKILSEGEAKAKAESIVKQARGGEDFVRLVKEHSQDPGSVAQNGDIGTGVRTSTTHIPETMRKAILALEPKQVSEPVRHENGYYVFRAELAGVLPYEQVREEIYKELKQLGFRKWQQQMQTESSIQFNNEEFFRSLAKDMQKQPQQ